MIYEHKYHKLSNTWHGTMLYNTNDVFIGKCLDMYGEWCIGEIEATLEYCAGNVLDIGANIGTHTIVYAKYAKKVFAFEPQPYIFNMLCANIALNALENVWTTRTAIGNWTDLIKMPHLDPSQQGNFGGHSVGEGTELCYIRTLDQFGFEDVSLIKIDVEGREQDVLQGAMGTIKACQPALYIENDRPDKQDALCQFIESIGYSWKWHEVPLFRKNNIKGCQENLFEGIGGINMLCLPKEEK